MSKRKTSNLRRVDVLRITLVIVLGVSVVYLAVLRELGYTFPGSDIGWEEKGWLPPVAPESFFFECGNFVGGDRLGVEYQHGYTFVTYSSMGSGPEIRTTKVPVSDQDLVRFVRSLNRADFAHWAPDYENPRIMGDSFFNFRLKTNGRTYESSGYNQYPEKYDEVLAAMRRLVKE